MKKLALLAVIGLSALSIVTLAVSPAFAQPVDSVERVCDLAAERSDDPDEAEPVICEASDEAQEGQDSTALLGEGGLITSIVQTVIYITGILSVIMIMVGGITIATSNGEPGGISSGKTMIIYSLVGLVVAIFGQAIVVFVLSKV